MEAAKTMVPSEFMGELLLNEEFSDVRVIVENETQMFDFPAHTFVLMRRSPVFKRMLESHFLEGQKKTIVIKDFKAAHVENFLRFIYTDTLPERCEDLCTLTKMAEKYMVPELKDGCQKALLDCVHLSNVYQLCNFAGLSALTDLNRRCLDLIKKAAFKLLKDDKLKCLSTESVENIVRAGELNVEKEVDVFWAVWRWGNLQLRYKGVPFSNEHVITLIKDILKYIRWNLIEQADLLKIKDLGIQDIPVPVHTEGDSSESDSDEEEDYEASREPGESNVNLHWFLNQCDILCVDEFANSCTLIPDYFKPCSHEITLLEAVSANDSPFYLVGVLFAFTKLSVYNMTQLHCFCSANNRSVTGTLSSDDENFLTMTASNGEAVEYKEVLCEFARPILFHKLWPIKITVRDLPKGGTVRMTMTGQLIKSNKGKQIFVSSDVYSVKKLFLL